MKNNYFIGLILAALILSFSVLSCSPDGVSKVTIRINLGLQNSAFNAPKSSVIDRVFSFFVKRAEAQAAPANITSINLKITGPDMDTINKTYPAPVSDIITVEVPSGESRNFEVIVNIDPSDSRAVFSYIGTATRNLASGATITIPISMTVHETKIIIPDYMNQRIVQIDDMSGTNWSTRYRTDIGYTTASTFYPQDIDFDSRGRIYIANDTSESAGAYQVVIIDNITSTTSTLIIPSNSNGMDAMTIDRNNDFIYYVQGTTIFRTNLDGTGSTSRSLSASIGLIRGMTIDYQGQLYIVGNNALGSPGIFVYNYTTSTIVNSVTNATVTSLSTPYHLLIKSPYLYVVNPSTTGSNNQILQLNLVTLQFIQGYGTYSLASTTQGNFYGPRHFVAVLNKKIYLIDEGPDNTLTSKLIAMDDINGTNWETYGTYGFSTTPGEFNFYFYC